MKKATAKKSRKPSEQGQSLETISVFKYQKYLNDFIIKSIQFAAFYDALIQCDVIKITEKQADENRISTIHEIVKIQHPKCPISTVSNLYFNQKVTDTPVNAAIRKIVEAYNLLMKSCVEDTANDELEKDPIEVMPELLKIFHPESKIFQCFKCEFDSLSESEIYLGVFLMRVFDDNEAIGILAAPEIFYRLSYINLFGNANEEGWLLAALYLILVKNSGFRNLDLSSVIRELQNRSRDFAEYLKDNVFEFRLICDKMPRS